MAICFVYNAAMSFRAKKSGSKRGRRTTEQKGGDAAYLFLEVYQDNL